MMTTSTPTRTHGRRRWHLPSTEVIRRRQQGGAPDRKNQTCMTPQMAAVKAPPSSQTAQFYLPTNHIYVAEGVLPLDSQRIAVLDHHRQFLYQLPLHRIEVKRAASLSSESQRRPSLYLQRAGGSHLGVRQNRHVREKNRCAVLADDSTSGPPDPSVLSSLGKALRDTASP